MSTKTLLILTVLVIIIIVIKPWRTKTESTQNTDTSSPQETVDPPKRPTYSSSPLADELHTPDSNAPRDLEIIQTLLTDYRLITKHGNPSGTNQEITSVLTGNNRFRIAPLPRTHQNISEKGELLDRFGSPYIFHNLSADFIEIRSCGPDKKARTDDDIINSSLPEHSTLRL